MEQLLQWYKAQGIPEAFVKNRIANMPKVTLKPKAAPKPIAKEKAAPTKEKEFNPKSEVFNPKSEVLAIELLTTLCDHDQTTILEALSIVNLEIVDVFGSK